MFRVLSRTRVVLGLLSLLAFLALGVIMISPFGFGVAGEFDELMGEAIDRGTGVDAARSRRDAAEASVRKAWSKFLPSIEAHSEFGTNRNNAFGRLHGIGREHYDSSEYGISASLPLYRGGANYYGLKEARDQAQAEGFSLEEARQILLLDTARAILGIIRDREIVALQRENRTIVGSILRSTERRFEGGEATRTDIEIARDQYTAAQSVYTQAIDNLHQNQAEFERIIGRAPGQLTPPRDIYQRLPKSLDEAISLAETQNPQLLAAGKRASAAQHAEKASYSKFLPSVDLKMDYSEDRYHGITTKDESDFSVKLKFSMPLFKPDALPSQHESRHFAEQRHFEARDARYQVKAMATISWRSFHTARKRYHLAAARIKAAEAAAKGMRRELEAGQRTVLDMLDTQERLVEAKVQAASAKYESYMAAHLLLSAVGELDVYSRQEKELSSYVEEATRLYKTRVRRNSEQRVKKQGPLNSGWRLQEAKVERRDVETTGALKQTPAKVMKQERREDVTKTPWQKRTVAYGEPFVKRVELAKISLPLMKPGVVKKTEALPQTGQEGAPLQTKQQEDKFAPQQLLSKSLFGSVFSPFDDEIVTGSLAKAEVKKTPLKRVRTLRFHDIPLPQRRPTHLGVREVKARHIKSDEVADPVVTGSVQKRVEEYPDTYNNRFAVWWNGNIDKVFGASQKKRQIKLVPLEEYHAKRKADPELKD